MHGPARVWYKERQIPSTASIHSGGSMFNVGGSKRCATLLFVVCLLATPALYGQVTSGNIAGTVTAKQDNAALPGVTVAAVHVPTGKRYTTVSGANGYYQILTARVARP